MENTVGKDFYKYPALHFKQIFFPLCNYWIMIIPIFDLLTPYLGFFFLVSCIDIIKIPILLICIFHCFIKFFFLT